MFLFKESSIIQFDGKCMWQVIRFGSSLICVKGQSNEIFNAVGYHFQLLKNNLDFVAHMFDQKDEEQTMHQSSLTRVIMEL